MEQFDKNVIKMTAIAITVVVVVILLAIFNPFYTVSSGEIGLIYQFGKINNYADAGFHVRVPLVDSVRKVDVTTQRFETDVFAYTKDLQAVEVDTILNYSVNKEQVMTLYSNVGPDFAEKIITPATSESIKAVVAQYSAEELITRRDGVSDGIKQAIADRLTSYGIKIEAMNIADFEFSDEFEKAAEAKLVAEQEALTQKNKLESVKYQAEQAVAEAAGKAEAMRIEGEALRANSELIELKAIEKWDGKMPTYTGIDFSLTKMLQ